MSKQTTRRKQVVVIGSSHSIKTELDIAYQVGKEIALRNFTLITGGRTGVMEAASKGAKEHGGLVIGILPSRYFEEANPYCDVIIPTGAGYMRNSINVLAADMVISIGGASGTLNELAFAWNYDKKIVALSNSGGWSAKLAGKAIDDRRTDIIIDAPDMATVMRELDQLAIDTSE